MTTAITLQVAGLDLKDVSTQELVAESFPEALWGQVGDIVTMTMFTDSASPVDHAASEADRLCATIPGAYALRVYQDVVAVSDIAERVGVSREAVRKWANVTAGESAFPAPLGALGGGDRGAARVWQWADVVRWLASARCIEMGEDLPDEVTVARINVLLAESTGARGGRGDLTRPVTTPPTSPIPRPPRR